MGNQATRQPLEKFQNEDKTEEDLLQMEELLFINEFPKFTQTFTEIVSKDAPEIYPVRSKYSPTDKDEASSQDKRLLNEVF